MRSGLHGRALLLLASLAVAPGCVEVNRGATVAFNLSEAGAAGPDEHYQLYAVVNGGAVPIERFKVLRPVGDCGALATLAPDIQLVQRYDVGVSREELCGIERRLGAIDKVDFATATVVGGVRVNTDIDLSDAARMFITVEPDNDADDQPSRVWLSAEMGPGVAPDVEVSVECQREFCEGLDQQDPMQQQEFDTFCTIPRPRRGVRMGVFLEVPYDDVCFAVRPGQIAVVPAEDDTFL